MKSKLNTILKEIRNNSLTKLDLSWEQIGDVEATALASALEENKSLKVLILTGNTIGNKGAKALADFLEKNNSLTELNLNNNQIGGKGAAALAGALEKNNSLTGLYLSVNQLEDEGAAAVASALEKNNSLIKLDLGYNDIGFRGALALASALAKNKSLEEFDFDNNHIGSKGAAAVASALEKNNSLTKLDLGYNGIGLRGSDALAGALEKNNTLTELTLENNRIGAKALVSALEKNNSLTGLYLDDKQVRGETAKALADALAKNSQVIKCINVAKQYVVNKEYDKALELYNIAAVIKPYNQDITEEITKLTQSKQFILAAAAKKAIKPYEAAKNTEEQLREQQPEKATVQTPEILITNDKHNKKDLQKFTNKTMRHSDEKVKELPAISSQNKAVDIKIPHLENKLPDKKEAEKLIKSGLDNNDEGPVADYSVLVNNVLSADIDAGIQNVTYITGETPEILTDL